MKPIEECTVKELFPLLNLTEEQQDERGLNDFKLPERVKLFCKNDNVHKCYYCNKVPNNISKKIRETNNNHLCLHCFFNVEDSKKIMEDFCDRYYDNNLRKTKNNDKIWKEENELFLRINLVLSWERKIFKEEFNCCQDCGILTHYVLKDAYGDKDKTCINCWRNNDKENTWEIMEQYFFRYSSLLD